MTLCRGDLDRYYPRTDGDVRETLAADVTFDYLLALMAQRQLFDVCDLTFKGGTALRNYRLGSHSRLSVDFLGHGQERTQRDGLRLRSAFQLLSSRSTGNESPDVSGENCSSSSPYRAVRRRSAMSAILAARPPVSSDSASLSDSIILW